MWDEFMKEVYQDGKKRVPNPNPSTRSRYPDVAITTALKDKQVLRKVMKEYAEWIKKRNEKDKKPSAPKQEEKPTSPLVSWQKEADAYLSKYQSTFASLRDKVEKEVRDYGKVLDNKVFHHQTRDKYAEQYKKMSFGEKVLHAAGHVFGQYFEENVLTSEEQKIHNQYMEQWRESSNTDESYEICGIVSSLGINGHPSPGDENDRERYDECIERGKKNEALRNYVKKSYAFTQAVFKYLGIEEVTLYRGVKEQIDGEPPEKGDPVQMRTREISSFSTAIPVAESFGRVTEYKVPVDRVFASCLTRPDIGGHSYSQSWDEYEFIIMGASDFVGKVIS